MKRSRFGTQLGLTFYSPCHAKKHVNQDIKMLTPNFDLSFLELSSLKDLKIFTPNFDLSFSNFKIGAPLSKYALPVQYLSKKFSMNSDTCYLRSELEDHLSLMTKLLEGNSGRK